MDPTTLITALLTALLACSFILPSAANAVVGRELGHHRCRHLKAVEPDLEKLLNEARGGAMTVELVRDLSSLNVRSVTDSSADHCPNTITGRKTSHQPNARAACPWTQVRYRAVAGEEPVYPDIMGGECCPQQTECMWSEGVRGSCARYQEFTSPHIQRTGRCRLTENGTYEWIYRAISVKVTKNCYCRYDANL